METFVWLLLVDTYVLIPNAPTISVDLHCVCLTKEAENTTTLFRSQVRRSITCGALDLPRCRSFLDSAISNRHGTHVHIRSESNLQFVITSLRRHRYIFGLGLNELVHYEMSHTTRVNE